MKSKIIGSIVAVMFMFVASAAMAGGHVTPTAPADYLSKKAPKKASKKALEKGAKTYKKKCKKCHGSKGDGKGTSAEGLKVAPTAFSAAGYMKGRSDGQLYWIIEKGSEGTDMEAFGLGTDANLSEKKIWRVIQYMQKEFTK
ncbi:MAG: c-type cytochrome [Proteobacteria bacterium]|nr:c-type cytochrome [Pseudomonadota bacterium]